MSTWLDPFSSPSDEGYQIVQSLYSIGSGGLSGLGLGGSREKFLLPAGGAQRLHLLRGL
ncbi:MAG: FtsW/RodA/SpoVE family cell cycle protein [Oscillospiraceae bacterium]